MKPSIGRIVIFCYDGNEAPAIVTYVCDPQSEVVNLTIFPGAFTFSPGGHTSPIAFREEWVHPQASITKSSKYWKWPERV